MSSAEAWVEIGAADELAAGERMVLQIDDKFVAVFNVDGDYFAIEDRCSHDDGELADGALNGCEIECSRHGAKFDIRTGKALSSPAIVDIESYGVKVEADSLLLAWPTDETN